MSTSIGVAAVVFAVATVSGACSTELVYGHERVAIPRGVGSAQASVVAYISGWSNAVAVRGRSRTFLVDAKQCGGTKEMLSWLDADGFPQKYVVGITHVHQDHVAGLTRLLEMEGDRVDTIFGAEAMSDFIHVPKKFQGVGQALDREIEPGLRVRIIPLGSAHTGADVAYHFPEHRLLVTGDVFQCGYYPHAELIDGGSFQGLVAALDLLLGQKDVDVVVGGHGGVCGRSELKAFRDEIAALVLVRASGQPVEPPLKLRPLRAIRTIASRDRVMTCAKHERDSQPRPWPRHLVPQRKDCTNVAGGEICWLKKGIISTGREDGC